jgi:phosphoenolpyruvate synthase/pyruvate phosphate dikinase
MKSAKRHVISCRTTMKKISERKVGGKAWNLFRLLHYGFRVPSFCVVSSSVFDEVVGAHGGEIDDVLSGIDFTDRSEVERAALGIESVVSGVEFPGWFSRELRAAVRTMFEKDALLSVRSSVIGEDSRENSFAGQMDSFLNVSV